MKTTFAIAAVLNAAALLPPPSGQAQARPPRSASASPRPARTTARPSDSSCAATSKKDAQADAWLSVPKGTCEKIVGGKLASSQS